MTKSNIFDINTSNYIRFLDEKSFEIKSKSMKRKETMDTIKSPKGQYRVGNILGETETFALYECFLSDDSVCILKIAKAISNNGPLDREAYILQLMREKAAVIEKEAARVEPGMREMGYQRFFPDLVESFIAVDQGNRRVNILSLIESGEKLSDLAPLEQLASREHVRVDPKTSVWILGKLLKMLDFAHFQGITVELDGENILINRERHLVTIFDWSGSTIIDGEVPSCDARMEISRAAKEVILALGGNPETGEIPKDSQLKDDGYERLLFSLVDGHETNAGTAHKKFYSFVRAEWPGKFHPFTAYALK